MPLSGDFEQDRQRVLAAWNRTLFAYLAATAIALLVVTWVALTEDLYWLLAMAALWFGAVWSVVFLWHRERVARFRALDPPESGVT